MSIINVFFQSLSPWFAKAEYTKSHMSDYYDLHFLFHELFSTVLDIWTCVCVYKESLHCSHVQIHHYHLVSLCLCYHTYMYLSQFLIIIVGVAQV